MLKRIFSSRSDSNVINTKIKKIQEGDEELRNRFISESQEFILNTVSSILKKDKEVVEMSDEYSIGLIAFDEAIESYGFEKGVSFSSFASLVIKRRIIDFHRKENKNADVKREIESNVNQHTAYSQYIAELEANERMDEIRLFTQELTIFGISFEHLASEVPKHIDAKRKSIEISKILASDKELREMLYEKKKLPIKELLTKVDVSKKTLERNRKYIIAMSVISIGNYRHLKEFLSV